MDSESHKPKFHTGQLVRMYRAGFIGIVEPSSRYEDMGGYRTMHYFVKVGVSPGRSEIYEAYGENSLRPITFKEYLWYRNPETGRMNVGRTPAWMVAWITVGTLAIFFCLNAYGFSWWSFAAFAMLVLLAIGTARNFKGKQA